MRWSSRFGCVSALLLAVVLAQTAALAHDHSHHHGVDAVDCALVHFSSEGKAALAFAAPLPAPITRALSNPSRISQPLLRRPSATSIRAPPFNA